MILNQRIIWNDNGTENDLSLILNDFRGQTVVFDFSDTDSDKLYIASDLPFNHRYFQTDVANAVPATVGVEIWDGKVWNSAVDILDHTDVSGASLAQDGIIQWKTNREKIWHRELDSEDVDGISSSIVGLYEMFWLRFTWNADLSGTTAIKSLTYKFAVDDALYSEYPDLNNANLRAAYAAGKTDWNEQHFVAGEHIIRDLKKSNIIRSEQQILDYEKFQTPAVHKAAEIIYGGLGRAFDDSRQLARKYYDEAMSLKFFNVDIDRNANLSPRERNISSGFFRR